ncbi:MAG: hypothetical protein QFX40_01880 [Archaeoglobales archaeon]|nr:hypothetical protein [Archaeoglobales archaeon]
MQGLRTNSDGSIKAIYSPHRLLTKTKNQYQQGIYNLLSIAGHNGDGLLIYFLQLLRMKVYILVREVILI